MNFKATRVSYRKAGVFSKVVTDYIDQADSIRSFFQWSPSLDGIRDAISARKNFPVDRDSLVQELKKQYGSRISTKVASNIEVLLDKNSFTITTAHQPNIFTGPLYFIYKIIHAIKLADHLQSALPGHRFVPVYYMGSEDADLDELGHIHLNGQLLRWNTQQAGAVGRMQVDKDFARLIDIAEGQLSVLPFGKEIIGKVKEYYKPGMSIQQATFDLVNDLFGAFGLIVLIPDNAILKKQTASLFKDDLLHQLPSEIVGNTIEKIDAAGYKVQANPREINLFYLMDGKRERIEKKDEKWRVLNTSINFTEEELLKELETHPERFSPNVILRGLFQEWILPNIIFIGGGGELAYWLQYKDLFSRYKVPFPVLVLRNSFLLIEQGLSEKMANLGFDLDEWFLPDQELLNRLVLRDSKNPTRLNGSLAQVEQLYETFKTQASQVDSSLKRHVDALKTKAIHRLQELEKKMLRAEKRKFNDQQRQIQSVKAVLFPSGGLQERHDNMMFYYAKWGSAFLQAIYDHSLTLEHEFVILEQKSV